MNPHSLQILKLDPEAKLPVRQTYVSGPIFQLITNDDKSDRALMANRLLKKRLYLIFLKEQPGSNISYDEYITKHYKTSVEPIVNWSTLTITQTIGQIALMAGHVVLSVFALPFMG